MFDTHAHVNFNAYKDDADEVIKRAQDKGVSVILVGSQFSTSERAIKMAEKYDNVYSAVALHPIHLEEQVIANKVDNDETVEFVSRAEEFDYRKYLQLAKSNANVVAVGETGLDYFHLKEDARDLQIEKQKQVFIKHIELANELNLPMIIHCREAYTELIEILKQNKVNKGGVIHCFIGNLIQGKKLLDMGFYLGFNGVITFKKAEPYLAALKLVPLDKILIETDCPNLTPVPNRGKRNEPSFVEFIIKKIADVKGLSFEEVEKQTDKNAKSLFNLL